MGEVTVLVLESSTSSAKALLYSSVRGQIRTKTRPYGRMYDDITIHDAEKVFQETAALGKEVLQGEHADVIALSGTWHSVMLTEEDGTPVTPVREWSNTEASDLCRAQRRDADYARAYYHRTGCMVSAIYPFFKLRMLKERGYDLSRYRVMGQGSYNGFRLTGRFEVTDCMASGSGLLNTHEKTYDREALKELGIREDQLGKLISFRDTAPLTAEGAALLGADAGIPVVAAGSDGGLNQVGAGALKEGVMTFSVGTSGAIRLATKQPILPEDPGTWCYLSPVGYLSGAATSGCCNCIDWCKEKLFPKDMSYADIEAGFTGKETDPVFLPFLFGERCPGWRDERQGGFFDVKGYHDAFDLYRAVQEGTLMNLYHCYRMLVKENGRPNRIMLSGGILASKRWTQMCADLFGEDMEIADLDQSSILGGAVLGLTVAGTLERPEDFEVHIERTVHPDPAMRNCYDDKFARYLDWYART